MRPVKAVTAAAVAICSVAAQAQEAGAPQAPSAHNRPAVVELFTSEGCSSCPPADRYLGELAGRGNVLALGFHVDYWDDLGWRDRFALPIATERQSLYSQALRRPSIYTPELLVDGRNDYVGSDRRAIERAVATARNGIPLQIAVQSPQLEIEVGSQERAGANEVMLVTYLRRAVTAIGRGENAGRTLEEFNIVRSIQNLGRWDGHRQQFHALLASLPADATDAAVLVQGVGQGAIIGAAATGLR